MRKAWTGLAYRHHWHLVDHQQLQVGKQCPASSSELPRPLGHPSITARLDLIRALAQCSLSSVLSRTVEAQDNRDLYPVVSFLNLEMCFCIK